MKTELLITADIAAFSFLQLLTLNIHSLFSATVLTKQY